MTLFNLVRGESKKRVNFLVTVAEGGREYVPTRVASMMIRAVGKNEKFKPKRSRSEGSNNGSSSDEEEPPTHTHFESPRAVLASSSSSMVKLLKKD